VRHDTKRPICGRGLSREQRSRTHILDIFFCSAIIYISSSHKQGTVLTQSFPLTFNVCRAVPCRWPRACDQKLQKVRLGFVPRSRGNGVHRASCPLMHELNNIAKNSLDRCADLQIEASVDQGQSAIKNHPGLILEGELDMTC
jgi:hypothetical protein